MNSQQRLTSLDVFRGLTIIAMIIVNSPGTSGPLSHAYWHGLTLADYIFPFFIFISGVSIAFQSRYFPLNDKQRNGYFFKIFKRGAILFLLGLAVNLIYTKFSAFRIAGVLQRIAIVYMVCSVLLLYCSTRQLAWIGGFILFTYWLILLFVPAPGLQAGYLERGENIANWLDYKYLPGMLWRGTWDPEGLLSTYPSIVSGILGVLAGKVIVGNKDLGSKINLLFCLGFICLLMGYLWSLYFVFNKALWTSSFVLVTGGVASLFLALFMWHIDLNGNRRYLLVSQVFGCNAIFAYILHVILSKALDPIQKSLVAELNHWGLPESVATALWICIFLILCFLPLYFMHKRKMFLKI